jgi:hypothetical protein
MSIVRRLPMILIAGAIAIIASFALTAAPAVAEATTADASTTRVPGAAAPAPWTYQILAHEGTGLCLDASASQGVRLNDCGTGYQLWRKSNDEWKHDVTLRCLDGSASQGVRLNTCDGGRYQDWISSSDGSFKNKTGLCLDASVSQGVRLNTCNNSRYQDWTVLS